MVDRREWTRACAIARRGGAIRPTLANLVAAMRIVRSRYRIPDELFFGLE